MVQMSGSMDCKSRVGGGRGRERGGTAETPTDLRQDKSGRRNPEASEHHGLRRKPDAFIISDLVEGMKLCNVLMEPPNGRLSFAGAGVLVPENKIDIE